MYCSTSNGEDKPASEASWQGTWHKKLFFCLARQPHCNVAFAWAARHKNLSQTIVHWCLCPQHTPLILRVCLIALQSMSVNTSGSLLVYVAAIQVGVLGCYTAKHMLVFK